MSKLLKIILGLIFVVGLFALIVGLSNHSKNNSLEIVKDNTIPSYSITKTGSNNTLQVLDSNNQSVQSIVQGQTYTISVVASTGYQIDSITLNGQIVQNNSTFTANVNVSINVTTSLITYTLTTTGSNCTIQVLDSNSQPVQQLTYGQTYTISVVASAGYQIDSITLNGVAVNNNSTFVASANTTINVVTSLITYTVTYLNYDDTTFATETVSYGGHALGPSTNPTRANYSFYGWVPSGREYIADNAYDNLYDFEISSNCSFKAYFNGFI